MTRATIFAEIKAARSGKAFTPGEVQQIDAVLDGLGVPRDAPEKPAQPVLREGRHQTALRDPAAFYAAVRGSLGAMKQSQVDGFDVLLPAMGAASWPITWAAYGLATAWHETARTMQPVAEGYWIRNAEDWRRKNLRYYPWYGRGYVQLTWEANYQWADRELGLGGKLLADPALAMKPEHAARIMVRGMEQGAFAKTHSLARHLPESKPASFDQFKAARRIINGVDKDDEIAELALKFQAALSAGGWA